ncbi:MAG: beta-N-acetylhexosaminidase, partial [Clostridia bacterium]|nr:beta-N-acetylhexosaminidase [Clostridia bacterium]
MNLTTKHFDGVYIEYDGTNAVLGFSTKPQEARARFLLSMKQNEGAFTLTEKPHFQTVGPMLDTSRGKVMTVEGVKRFLDKIQKLGLNMLMLYTEDLFEVEGYPQFGYQRGRYTLEELRELDRYAASL